MNGARKKNVHRIDRLPADIEIVFNDWGAPERKHLRPHFKRLGSDVCLKKLKVKEYSDKRITLRLPEALACYGPGRYEACVLQEHCKPCDCVEIVFEATCGIERSTVTLPRETPDDC